jgi:hypothetical protein
MNANFSSGLVAKLFLTAILLIGLLPGQPAQAYHTQDETAAMFHDALAPYGNWVHHRTYGKVWYPRHVPRDWRPYTDGYWSYTRNYGWLWVSDWVWGWAPFHYGRWVWDDWYGWVWVPGTLWAPAWVFWQYGGGYLSWAPMPPHYIWNPYVRYSTFYFDYDRYVNWDSWVFVHERDFPRRHHRPRRLIAPDRNRDLLRLTRHAGNMTVVNNVIVNQGIPVHHIEQATGKRIKPEVPKLMTKSEWSQEDRRRGRVSREPAIYRPIDVKPTADTVRQQEQHARQFSERLGMYPPGVTEHSRSEQERLPRVPGRLSGKPVPLEYVDPQEPAAIPSRIPQPAEPLWTLPGNGESPPLGPGGSRNLQPERVIDRDRELERQQQDLERQLRAEEERLQRESARQQEEGRRRQLDLERQQQAEQERLQQESVRQQREISGRRQLELERQRQDEQRRMEQEAAGRQEQLYRRQQGELQQQIEQQQRARDAARQIEELNRRQEQLYRQPPSYRQQQPTEWQEPPEDGVQRGEGLRPQREMVPQPIMEQPSLPQQTDGQVQPDQGGRGRSGRSLNRSQRSR